MHTQTSPLPPPAPPPVGPRSARPRTVALAVAVAAVVIGIGLGVVVARSGDPDRRVSSAPATAPAPASTVAADYWTVILASVPKGPGAVDAADDRVAALRAAEVDAAAIDSDRYPTLARGYLVVHSGEFETERQALAHQRALAAAGTSGGYVKRVGTQGE